MRAAHGLVIAALAGVCASAVPAAVAAPTAAGRPARARRAKPKAPVGLALAKADVAALTAARSASRRVAALETLLGHAGVPVLSAAGRHVAGPRTVAEDDGYLYEPEVRLVAAQLAQKRLSSYDALAAYLAQQGATQGSGPLTGATLRAEVRAATHRDAARPKSKAATFGLIVQRLGRLRGKDPASGGAPAAADLDAVQRLLITAAALAPSIHPGRGGATARSLDGFRRVVAVAAANPCDSADSAGGSSTGVAALKYLAGLRGYPVLNLVNSGLDALHGSLLAFSFGVTKLSPEVVTASFGTEGPGSAVPAKFEIRVDMRDDIPQAVIDCGWLAGYTIPPKGPVSGAKVGWTKLEHLRNLGSAPCPSSTCQNTNSDGIATLVFTADDEYLPGEGEHRFAGGVVDADVFLQQSSNNASGAVSEHLGLTKGDAFGWAVDWHQPRGYEVNVPTFKVSRICDDMGDDCTYDYATVNQRQCLAQLGQPELHPTLPRPTLGLDLTNPPDSFGRQSALITDKDGMTDTGSAIFSMAASLNGVGLDSRGWEDGGEQIGHFLFDAGHHTLRYEAKFLDGTASPSETLFPDLPVTDADSCPPLPKYPDQFP